MPSSKNDVNLFGKQTPWDKLCVGLGTGAGASLGAIGGEEEGEAEPHSGAQGRGGHAPSVHHRAGRRAQEKGIWKMGA